MTTNNRLSFPRKSSAVQSSACMYIEPLASLLRLNQHLLEIRILTVAIASDQVLKVLSGIVKLIEVCRENGLSAINLEKSISFPQSVKLIAISLEQLQKMSKIYLRNGSVIREDQSSDRIRICRKRRLLNWVNVKSSR